MFIDNKYCRIYYKIINGAKLKEYSVFEIHHIIPKSLGGTNCKGNLIKLSLKEHYICHQLLVKMTSGQQQKKMEKALYLMSKKHGFKVVSSSAYEKLKLEFYKSCKGPKKWTEAGKKKLHEIGKQRVGEKNGFYGKRHSEKAIEQNRKAHLGKTMSSDQKLQISGENSSRFIGYYHTPWGIFPSSSIAERHHDYLKAATIHRWCINSDKLIFRLGRSIYLKQHGSSCIGKTYRDLGFFFEPKQP